MDRNLALEFVRVTEAAAIAAAVWVGKKDPKAADQAAVDEMRDRFNQIAFAGRIVIGEGDKDEAPKLFIGETVGTGGGPEMDLAVDPLECTDSVAHGRSNAQSMIVSGPRGSLLHAPDTYMFKIATGKAAAGVIDINASVEGNIKKVAQALGKKVTEVTVIMLDRPRHEQLAKEIQATGARIKLITDGDVAAAIATCMPGSGVDLLLGIGGSTEAVLAAAPVKLYGGQLYTRFQPRHEADEAEVRSCLGEIGIHDLSHVFSANDLAKGNTLTFTATGILSGPMLDGVIVEADRIITHSVVMRGTSGTVRFITTHHRSTS